MSQPTRNTIGSTASQEEPQDHSACIEWFCELSRPKVSSYRSNLLGIARSCKVVPSISLSSRKRKGFQDCVELEDNPIHFKAYRFTRYGQNVCTPPGGKVRQSFLVCQMVQGNSCNSDGLLYKMLHAISLKQKLLIYLPRGGRRLRKARASTQYSGAPCSHEIQGQKGVLCVCLGQKSGHLLLHIPYKSIKILCEIHFALHRGKEFKGI